MPELLSALNPGLLLIAAGLICAMLPQRQVRQAITVITPIAALFLLLQAPHDINLATTQFVGLDLILYRVDNLNFVFGIAFLIAAFLNAIYALHDDNRLHDGVALIYAGAAIAACFAGDLMTIFIFWEITAISSVVVILQSRTRAAYGAAMRYLAIQILSGVLLLDGAAYYLNNNGDLFAPQVVGQGIALSDPGAWLLFVAFGIKAAFPLLHNWLQDSYPKATVTGAVVLSAFTTKLAVYAFARFFPGESALIWIGAIMTVFPVFFAVIENDLRKVLAYSLNNQVGFMICAIGIGTSLALNGAAAHAFVHIIYKGLLFMSMGAVLYRTGTTKASELGGLFRSMPMTAVFCIIGAMSISAFPLFSGFVAKSMTMSAVGHEGMFVIWAMLLFASAGVLEHSGIKIPYFAFFGHDSGKRVKEAPFNMLVAMGIAAFLCIAIGLPGVVPGFGYQMLYSILPFPAEAMAYGEKSLFTISHIVTQMQLLMLALFAFILLKRFKVYPAERPGTVLDFDWTYRKLGFDVAQWANRVWNKAGPAMSRAVGKASTEVYERIEAASSPQGQLSKGLISQSMAVWTGVLLGIVLVLTLIVSG